MPCPPEPPPGAAIACQVQARGIRDRRVLRAIGLFDRERFVPPEQRPRAGHDSALPIGFEQTISQPYIVAAMTEALQLVGRERILEVGTGSGYQTAILAALAGEVFTIERLPTLSLRARGLLDGLGIANVRYRIGDGSLGWPEEAPFDRILIAAGSPDEYVAKAAVLAQRDPGYARLYAEAYQARRGSVDDVDDTEGELN